MAEMFPTNRLRFVERSVCAPPGAHTMMAFTARILQQWWELDMSGADVHVIGGPRGEWRDVPVETE